MERHAHLLPQNSGHKTAADIKRYLQSSVTQFIDFQFDEISKLLNESVAGRPYWANPFDKPYTHDMDDQQWAIIDKTIDGICNIFKIDRANFTNDMKKILKMGNGMLNETRAGIMETKPSFSITAIGGHNTQIVPFHKIAVVLNRAELLLMQKILLVVSNFSFFCISSNLFSIFSFILFILFI